MKKKFISMVMITSVFCGILFFVSCKKDQNGKTITVISDTVKLNVNFSANSPYAFFSFKNNGIVNNVDSATGKWDFGIRLATFLVNSNASGPGNAGVILQNGIFDQIISAPATGYAYDTTSSRLAISDGSWYNYDMSTHSFIPKPGKVFIFRTADNHYAKMEIMKVEYEPFTGPVPRALDYTFRFVYQANGSTDF
ncbi:MAG: HmuY family protein [Bacteroidetes bacterium]|nr:HmuY family protein [Bacteroidota bacterium]MBS1633932.1 HmuY family protein [Bacteroidota bacterium]